MARHVANSEFLTQAKEVVPNKIDIIITKVNSVQTALENKEYYGTNAERLKDDMDQIMKAFGEDTNRQLQEMVDMINDVMQWVVDIVSTGLMWDRITIESGTAVQDANMNSSLAAASAGEDNYIDGDELYEWADAIDLAFNEIVEQYEAINTFLFDGPESTDNWQGPTKDGGEGFGQGARMVIGEAIDNRIGVDGPWILEPGAQAETLGTVRGTGSALSAWVRGQARATEAGAGSGAPAGAI